MDLRREIANLGQGVGSATAEQPAQGPAHSHGTEGNSSTPPFWHVPSEFGFHILIGSLIFVLIALPAVGLGLVVKWLETMTGDRIVTMGLRAAEYGIFGTDLVLFGVYLTRTTWRAMKRL